MPSTELAYCVTVAFTNLLPFNLWEKPEVTGSQTWAIGGLTDLGDVMFCRKKSLHESCRMSRRIVVVKLICSFGHCECDGHTVHKLSQGRLTADWLASRESDCSRTRSKVSSDWVPSYIKATRPVLEQFKLARYFPDSPRRCQNRDMKLVLYWGPTNIRQHRPYRSRHSHPATEIVVAMAIWRRGLVYPAEYNSHTFTD